MDSRYNSEVEWPGFAGKLCVVYAHVGDQGKSSRIKGSRVSSLSN